MDRGYNAIPFHNVDFLLLWTGVGFITHSFAQNPKRKSMPFLVYDYTLSKPAVTTTVLTAVSFALF